MGRGLHASFSCLVPRTSSLPPASSLALPFSFCAPWGKLPHFGKFPPTHEVIDLLTRPPCCHLAPPPGLEDVSCLRQLLPPLANPLASAPPPACHVAPRAWGLSGTARAGPATSLPPASGSPGCTEYLGLGALSLAPFYPSGLWPRGPVTRPLWPSCHLQPGPLLTCVQASGSTPATLGTSLDLGHTLPLCTLAPPKGL